MYNLVPSAPGGLYSNYNIDTVQANLSYSLKIPFQLTIFGLSFHKGPNWILNWFPVRFGLYFKYTTVLFAKCVFENIKQMFGGLNYNLLFYPYVNNNRSKKILLKLYYIESQINILLLLRTIVLTRQWTINYNIKV